MAMDPISAALVNAVSMAMREEEAMSPSLPRLHMSEGGNGRGGTSGAEIFSVEQSIVTKEEVGEEGRWERRNEWC